MGQFRGIDKKTLDKLKILEDTVQDIQDNGTGVAVGVVDNLTSTDATKALSAKQGKNLSDQIGILQQSVTALQAGGMGGSGSGVIFEDLAAGETVTIDTGTSSGTTTTPPADTTAPVLTITPSATFSDSQTVSMSVNETADIYYTLDGSTPTTSSSKYTGAIILTATTTIKAFARDTAGNISAVQTITYTKQQAQQNLITSSPASGSYTSAQQVALTTSVAGGTIRYTTDGTTPTASSTAYNGTKINWGTSGTIRAIVIDANGVASSEYAFYYYIGTSGNGRYSYATSAASIVTTNSGVQFDQIEVDLNPVFSGTAWQYYLDFRGAGIANGYFARTSSGVDELGTAFSEVRQNGVVKTPGTAIVTGGVRQTLSVKLKTAASLAASGNFLSTGSNHLNADVYAIRFLLNGAVVADFDLTLNYGTGLVFIDESGLQLRNNSGVWAA